MDTRTLVTLGLGLVLVGTVFRLFSSPSPPAVVDVPGPDEPHRLGREAPAFDDAALASLVTRVAGRRVGGERVGGERVGGYHADDRSRLEEALAERAAAIEPVFSAVDVYAYHDDSAAGNACGGGAAPEPLRLFKRHAFGRRPAVVSPRGGCDDESKKIAAKGKGKGKGNGPRWLVPPADDRTAPKAASVPIFCRNDFARRMSDAATAALESVWSDPAERVSRAPHADADLAVTTTRIQGSPGWLSIGIGSRKGSGGEDDGSGSSVGNCDTGVVIHPAAYGAHSVLLLVDVDDGGGKQMADESSSHRRRSAEIAFYPPAGVAAAAGARPAEVPLGVGDACFLPAGWSARVSRCAPRADFFLSSYVDASNMLEFSARLALAREEDLAGEPGLREARRQATLAPETIYRAMGWDD